MIDATAFAKVHVPLTVIVAALAVEALAAVKSSAVANVAPRDLAEKIPLIVDVIGPPSGSTAKARRPVLRACCGERSVTMAVEEGL